MTRLLDDPAACSVTFGLGLCETGKYRYDTRPAADRAEKAFHRHSHRHLSIYRCETCHGYHLGSSLSRGRLNTERR